MKKQNKTKWNEKKTYLNHDIITADSFLSFIDPSFNNIIVRFQKMLKIINMFSNIKENIRILILKKKEILKASHRIIIARSLGGIPSDQAMMSQ